MKNLLAETGWNESPLETILWFFHEKEKIEQDHPEFKVLDMTRDHTRILLEGNGMRGWVDKEILRDRKYLNGGLS